MNMTEMLKPGKKEEASSVLPGFNICVIFIVIPSQHVSDFFKKFQGLKILR